MIDDHLVSGSTSLDAPAVDVPFDVLDIETVDEFRFWAKGIAATSPAALVLDLAGVALVTAAGISALLDVERELRPGVPLVIVNAVPIVRRVLAICELDTRWLRPTR